MLETDYLPVLVLRAGSKLKLLYERIELNEFRTIPVNIEIKKFTHCCREKYIPNRFLADQKFLFLLIQQLKIIRRTKTL